MKVGLVLEGGGLRAIFSSGVLDAMLEMGLMVDYAVGASAGIAYGVSYLARQPRRNLQIITQFIHDPNYMGIRHLFHPTHPCYFGLEFIYETIPRRLAPFDYAAFQAFPGQVEAVVTNLETGSGEYMAVSAQDPKATVLQATCALPLLFPIYWIQGSPYLDGGISDPIPFQRAFDQGCDRVIVILTKPRTYVRSSGLLDPLVAQRYRKYPNFCRTMAERPEQDRLTRQRLFQLEQEGQALVFAPPTLHGVGRMERNVKKLRLLWAEGYQQGMEGLDELRRFMGQGGGCSGASRA